MFQTACPSRITAGDTPSWVYLNEEYPSSAWTLALYLSAAAETPHVIQATADPDGQSFDLALTAALSATLPPGIMHYKARVTSIDLSQVFTIAYGETRIFANATQAFDERSFNEINLIAVEAGIAARVAGTVMDEYTISGVTCKMPPLAKLIELRAFFQSEIRREKGRNVMRAIPVWLKPNRGGIVPFGFNRRPW